MRGDQSAPRARRTGLIIFMTLCHRRGVVQEMRCLLPIDDVTNLRRRKRERERKRADDSTLLVLLTTTCHPVTGIYTVAFYFASFLPYYLLRRLGELMDVDITDEEGHGKRDDGDEKDETVHEIY